MPINSNYVLIGATAIRTPYGVAVLVGPVSLEGLPNLIKNWLVPIEAAKGEIKLPITNQNLSYQNWDPCYAVFQNLASSGVYGSGGVYTSGNYTFLWGMQALESQGALGSTYGVQAVEDNYGDTFYYDSCILMFNSLTSINPPDIGAQLMGDVAYTLTNSSFYMHTRIGLLYYLIGGFDMYTSYESLGNEVEFNGICYPYFYNAYIADVQNVYEPTPMSSVGSFSIGFSFPPPGISITYTPPSSGGVLIGVSTTPYYKNEINYYAYNLTWTFNYAFEYTTSGTYIDGFVVGPNMGAAIFLEQYSPGGEYWFYLPFNAEVETNCWSAWANTAWIVGLVTSSSNTTSISTANYGLAFVQSNVPSGSWISGYSIPPSPLSPVLCSGVSLSGPS
jgi:hypothetical protein